MTHTQLSERSMRAPIRKGREGKGDRKGREISLEVERESQAVRARDLPRSLIASRHEQRATA